MWNTGCRRVVNLLPIDINLLDGEDYGQTVTVPASGFADFHSVIFPWCNRTSEVTTKAFRVSNLEEGTTHPKLYIYQNYGNNRIYWSDAADADPWATKHEVNDGSQSNAGQQALSAIDLYIQADRVWSTPAVNDNAVFQHVLQGIQQGVTLVGGIVNIVKGVGDIVKQAAALEAEPEQPQRVVFNPVVVYRPVHWGRVPR